MTLEPIPYGRQQITETDLQAVRAALLSPFLTQGPLIPEFEERFASYVGARHAVAVSNGTAGLHLAALALGVGKDANVITTPITFVASANCARYCGANVHFADIDPATYLLSLESVRRLVEAKPRGYFAGVVAVDFAGRAVDLEALRAFCDAHGLWIIEDACHAPGGYFRGASGGRETCGNGRWADLAVFSFHPVKHIACGEGGMVTTNSEELYRRLLRLRTHGITRDAAEMEENHGGWYYEQHDLGFNYRLTDFQAALGISQLAQAAERLEVRREIARRYAGALSDWLPLRGHSGIVEGHAYHLYVIEVDGRKSLYEHLRGRGIHAQVHYIPVHLQPYYRRLGGREGLLPHAERYYARCLSLPMFPSLSTADQDRVIEAVRSWRQE